MLEHRDCLITLKDREMGSLYVLIIPLTKTEKCALSVSSTPDKSREICTVYKFYPQQSCELRFQISEGIGLGGVMH